MLSRRELLSTLSTLWLARAARAGESLRARLLRLDEASRALAAGKLSTLEWQGAAGEVCQGIDLAELCRAVDLDRLAARLTLLDRGTSDEATRLLPGQTFTPKIFALGRGRAIIPHGHRNMVSQHLVDRAFRPGDCSSISDQRDNVHWFVATSGRAYTLDCIVDNIDRGRGYRFQIDFVDPLRAERERDGTLRVPRLELDDCLQRYG